MLQRLDLRGKGLDVGSMLPRPKIQTDDALATVREIVSKVRQGGDAAVRELVARFDGAAIDDLRIPQAEMSEALARIPARLREALEAAKDAISLFHGRQVPSPTNYQRRGITVREIVQPVEKAGLYIPGGRATYPSTVLMTAVPARVAGVGELVACVPSRPDGTVPVVTLAALALAGVDRAFRIGGAQAIAAMAYGTETVPQVDVIVGPGNIYVSLAKREVSGQVGVPSSFAGPSEAVVIADGDTPVDLAAIDVVVQAEHGPSGLAWLVTWSEETASEISETVQRFVQSSPRRQELEATLGGGGYAVLVEGPEQALAVANALAPEHLELMSADPDSLLPLVRNAGAVFTGPFSPASVGDYLAGTNHVLPTYGSARFASALRVEDFLKRIQVVSLDEDAVVEVAPHVVAIAEAEGLAAHAESVRLRCR